MPAVDVKTVPTTPFADQRPGTSGLRKKTREFMRPHYVENFVQSVFDAIASEVTEGFQRKTLVVGGDGRYYNRAAIQTIIRLAAGNGFGRVLVGRGGLLSTPATSAVIRKRGALGGFVLSASHNPGGIEEDFGIKYNIHNGGPSPEPVTELIYRQSLRIDRYLSTDSPDIDIDREGTTVLGSTKVEVFNPLADYTELMEQLFDFPALRAHFQSGFRMLFDGMHGVTGPYAKHILEERLGAPEGTVLNALPLEDFAGHHPDPNLVYAADFFKRFQSDDSPDFGAACDADGDRNMIVGRKFFVSPGDSLALIAEHAPICIPAYRGKITGVARSLPTTTAVDRVAASLGVPCYETPTGWKFFGNLMDAGLCTLCGEESFGTGSNHVREKDGIWAVLCWLSLLAATKTSLAETVRTHWRRFGRSYFQRHDYEGLPGDQAKQMLEDLRSRLPELSGQSLGEFTIGSADDFRYTDPVDHSQTTNAGVRIRFKDASRIVCRLSGTGTEGATLRVYLERYSREHTSDELESALAPLADAARQILGLKKHFGYDQPTLIT